MGSRPVSRCVAIASHGKRCQQSRFKGSPFCWHHTQSRKIFAPSRPLGSAAGPRPALVERARIEPERLAAVTPAPAPAAIDPVALGSALVETLGVEVAGEVLRFARDGLGMLTLVSAGGPVLVRRMPARGHLRPAAGAER